MSTFAERIPSGLRERPWRKKDVTQHGKLDASPTFARRNHRVNLSASQRCANTSELPSPVTCAPTQPGTLHWVSVGTPNSLLSATEGMKLYS